MFKSYVRIYSCRKLERKRNMVIINRCYERGSYGIEDNPLLSMDHAFGSVFTHTYDEIMLFYQRYGLVPTSRSISTGFEMYIYHGSYTMKDGTLENLYTMFEKVVIDDDII